MADFSLLREKLQDLPVHKIIDPVVKDVLAGNVTIVTASTGSGKSMILPGALADACDHQIVVLEPRRFLAFDSAFNVAELAGLKIGEEVGYALGQINGERSQHSDKTRLLYCTYGFALSSETINTANLLVRDEVHEKDEYMSLVGAILFERKKADPSLCIADMSATILAELQARYWRGVANTRVHAVEGKALDCDIVYESTMAGKNKGRTAEEIAVSLLEEGRKGIVVFRPGVREVENTVLEIQDRLTWNGVRDVEVVGVHGGSTYDEHAAARRAPGAGKRKVIVGTNVIESGVNLRWLDAGISDGYRKIPYHRDDTGADALIRQDLPQAGLLQQIGRVNRDPAATGFSRGLFILHSQNTFEARDAQNGPAIERECLNRIAFYAASLGYNPTKLTWDITSAQHAEALPARLEQAKQELMRLQLVYDDWTLTENGKFITHLPVSPESGALLCEAKKLDEQRMRAKKPPRVVRDAVIIAAIAESHGLRKNSKSGFKSGQNFPSDLLEDLSAFCALRKEAVAQEVLAAPDAVLASASADELVAMQQKRAELGAMCLKQNVSLNGFMEVARLSDEIAGRLCQDHTGIRIDARGEEDTYDSKRIGELQRCILNANVNRLFIYENEGLRDLLRDFGGRKNKSGQPFNGYELSRSSCVPPPEEETLMVGGLREVGTDKSWLPPLLVLTGVTAVPPEVFIAWAATRAENYQPIVSEGLLIADRLNAKYAGNAKFEISVPPKAHALASALADEIRIPQRSHGFRKNRQKYAKSTP